VQCIVEIWAVEVYVPLTLLMRKDGCTVSEECSEDGDSEDDYASTQTPEFQCLWSNHRCIWWDRLTRVKRNNGNFLNGFRISVLK
ncbi:hypothetical protein L195_g054250, partial [Trifolium pratense]